MKAHSYIHSFGVFSRHGGAPKPASKSEVRGWLRSGAVLCNGEFLYEDEEMDFPVFSLVLFPKGNRVTLW